MSAPGYLLGAVVVLAAACNPYRNHDRLPAARCRTHADCPGNQSCGASGRCGLLGWATGRLTPLDPDGADISPIRLEVEAVPAARPVVRADGRYLVRGLPRGQLALVARCGGARGGARGDEAGRTFFVVDGGRGHVPASGATRELEVDIAVDTSICTGRR
jgi:hypothetical protein